MVSDLPNADKIQAELGNSIRWTSPELLNLERFHTNTGPTEESDCFGLGMLIYEVLSGLLPYHQYNEPVALLKILHGEQPERGTRFPNGLWTMLRLCWKREPDERPSLEDVFRCLQDPTQPLWKPPHDVGGYHDGLDSATDESSMLYSFVLQGIDIYRCG